jgi:DNA (cytosine-5)-methyltransferase 1
MKNKKFTVGGLFSGVGGIELGFEKSGFDVIWANEIDKNSCTTYRKNFSHTLYEEDIRNLKGKDLEPVDILCGGFPCQAFSIAGYRKGFEDDRGNVFFEIIRLINELKKKPKVLFLENVKNFKSHDNGKTFQTVINIINKQGYSVFFDVLNTCDFTKIPQNRERTFLICFKDEFGWEFSGKTNSMSFNFSKLFPPQKIKSNKSITDYLETKEVPENFYYRQDKYMYTELRKTMKSRETLYQWRRQYVRENKNNKCPTLTANMGTGGHNVPLVVTDDGFRKLTPRECFNFQGFPKGFKFPNDMANSHLYKQAGNAVTVDMIAVLAKKIYKVIV